MEKQFLSVSPAPVRRRERLLPNPKLKLREQVHEVARFQQLAQRTEEAYWDWIRRFLQFHRTDFTAEAQRRGGEKEDRQDAGATVDKSKIESWK